MKWSSIYGWENIYGEARDHHFTSSFCSFIICSLSIMWLVNLDAPLVSPLDLVNQCANIFVDTSLSLGWRMMEKLVGGRIWGASWTVYECFCCPIKFYWNTIKLGKNYKGKSLFYLLSKGRTPSFYPCPFFTFFGIVLIFEIVIVTTCS